MAVDKKQFAESLRAVRLRVGWTQEQAAKKLSVSKRKYCRWEDADDDIWLTVGEFYHLGEVFDLDPVTLLGSPYSGRQTEHNQDIKLRKIITRMREDRKFFMFVYAAMSKTTHVLDALLDYWNLESADYSRRANETTRDQR